MTPSVNSLNLSSTDPKFNMPGFDCHGRWVREFGDPENFNVLVLSDSQLRPKCERPGDFITVPGMLIWSISGGKMRDFKKLLKLKKSVAARARLIITAGIGSNDLTRIVERHRVPGKVVRITGKRGQRKYHLSGPTYSNQGRGNDFTAVIKGYRELYKEKIDGQNIISISPFPRRTDGHANKDISLFESAIRALGLEHHHIKTLRYYTARPRGTEVYGGAHPLKELKYRDDVHINDVELNQLLGCLYEISDIFLGPGGPPREVAGRCLTTCPQFKFKF